MRNFERRLPLYLYSHYPYEQKNPLQGRKYGDPIKDFLFG